MGYIGKKKMDFVSQVINQLDSVFKKYNFVITERFKNCVKLQSRVTITICHNELENSNALFIARNNQSAKCEIDNKTLHVFFNSNIRLSEVTQEEFIKNLILFFEEEGQLLNGNLEKMRELENWDQRRSEIYTNSLLKNQDLNSAIIAWENGNYQEYINRLDKMDKEQIPPSYKVKYKKAQQKSEKKS